MEQITEADDYKRRINRLLQTIPGSVNSGSYDHSVAYKKAVGNAQKAAAGARTSVPKLIQAYNELNSFY